MLGQAIWQARRDQDNMQVEGRQQAAELQQERPLQRLLVHPCTTHNHTLYIHCTAALSSFVVHRCSSASTAAKGSPTPQPHAQGCCSGILHSQKWQEEAMTGPTKHVHHNRRALLEAEGVQLSPGALGDGSLKCEHSAQDHGCRVSRTV